MKEQRVGMSLDNKDEKHKEYKYLYQKMLDENIIRKAYKKLRKGKTKRKEIIAIDANLDIEVAAMRRMIENTKPPDVKVEHPELAYKPHKRTPKIIFEHGKKRKIYMPEIHEQWLHHIIVLILEPIITATAYPLSCGSFPKRGAHYGKKAIMKWLKSGDGIRYFAKIDIRHFYDNIRIKILMRELAIRIKDTWFLYIIRLCLSGFKKGIPLGFYISQWLANYILEPLDKFITERLGLKKFVRYMDDMVFYANAKKVLHGAIAAIRQFIGRRFRLKLKNNYQVCRFHYEKKGKVTGRPLDFMGFLFFRSKVLIRKHIMLEATRLARRLHKAKEAGRGYYEKHLKAMLSYMGWFDCTDTYDCYQDNIKPFVDIGRLKKIVSKLDRRKNKYEAMERREMCPAA
jgi:retron-type reverse transcriptase